MYPVNKYSNWYNQIINRAQNRSLPTTEYTEIHHIIPKSWGGEDKKFNLVKLTAREHFLCHLLLPKMSEGRRRIQMLEALLFMSGLQKYRVTSKMYETARCRLASANSAMVDELYLCGYEPVPNPLKQYKSTSVVGPGIRPVCSVCESRLAEVNLIKNGVRYYRSKCRVCNIGRRKRIPLWARKGYKKKPQCDHCGFKAVSQEQLDVFHLDGDLRNCSHTNLKTICKNCQITLRLKGFVWTRGDLQPDF